MAVTRAVVLVIDRLGAGWIGPYGNTWLETPNFNRLAAESLLFETVLSDSPDLAVAYRGLWTGRHALSADPAAEIPFARQLSSAGGRSALLTDEDAIANHPLAASFVERRAIGASLVANVAESVEQTGMFRFFEAARSLVEEQARDGLLWLHSRGMSGPWDGPLALRYQFADDEDPVPPDFAEPPRQVLPASFDPDLLLGYSHAYAGQVSLADMCLGMLLDALDEHPLARETVLIVTSPRGYPLGEHRRVGDAEQALYSELLQVPLLVRMPGSEPTRVQRIVQPTILPSLLAAALSPEAADALAMAERAGAFDLARPGVAIAAFGSQRAIRTPAWFMRQETSEEGDRTSELFAKPDDRWEANEVSSRCGDAVELLAAELARAEAAAGGNGLAETAPLPELLCDIWR